MGVIGAGLIGSRRAATASASPRSSLAAVADVVEDRAATLASRHSCRYTLDWREVVEDPEVDAVVVATVNRDLSPIAVAAMENGKNVLCEKPPGRNASEAALMADAARRLKRTLKIGFTLRFHPALRKAKDACQTGRIGELYFIRAAYGHGGRPGYSKEWRASPELAGGGELLDQGVHLLDLARWFLGDGDAISGMTRRWFWEIAPLEDNAFVLFTTPNGQVATLHTSWTQWRNRFNFEIYGRDGYLGVEGLGGSYGTETLTFGRRKESSEPPTEERLQFSGPDRSWEDDWDDFVESIESGRRPAANGDDGLAVMRLVDSVYALSSRQASHR